MALLYEYSRLWRWIVDRSRNPVFMAAFSVTTVGVFAGIGYLAQWSTPQYTTVDDLRKEAERDYEMARHVRVNRDALATLLANAKGTENVEEGYTKIRLPQVEWHPAVMAAEKEAEEARARKAEEAAKSAATPASGTTGTAARTK